MDYIPRRLERKFLKMSDKFKVLDVPGVQVGSGGVVCMCDSPYPIDARNSFIPSNLL